MQRSIKVGFTDFWHGNNTKEIQANPIYQFLSRYYKVELSENPDFLFYSCFGHRFLKYKCTRIFYTGENTRPDFGQCDYAFSFDYPVTQRNYRLPLYHLYGYTEKLRNRAQPDPGDTERKFCNFVYSNKKATERIEFFKQLNRYKRVDSGGKIFNNIGGRVGKKLEFLRNYKFTIAFENSSHPGYTTEKIAEALLVNSIPIYWGNPDVTRDFNPGCLINCHDFKSFEDVIDHVIKVDNDDELFKSYVTEPVFLNGVDNEFVNEDNLVKRFEEIISGSTRSLVAGRYDHYKYWFHPLRPWDFAKSLVRYWKQHHRQIKN